MNAIPYTVERRPDTGVNNVELGIWLFLASEVMLFGGLFSAYFMLRAGAASPWLPLRDRLAGAVLATVVLLLGTTAVGIASRAVPRYRRWLVSASLFALLFCLFKFGDYRELLGAQRGPASSTQMATYFLLTGVHLLHVLGGMLANVWVMLRGGAAPDPAAVANRLRALLLYWGFVDAVWLVILILLYVA
jgi:heme/copper-type cytochrome/quinol oxidase subunit 3